MTGTRDRFGEVFEPIDDDEPVRIPGPTPRTRDEIHRDRCAELRRILRESRERRERQR
ncbi:MAG TPA: hypothetical protein VIJ07_22465 [Dermatophilaceae bacterium]